MSVHHVLMVCWDNFNPIKFVLNNAVIWDDSTSNMSILDIEKYIINNEEYKNMLVKEVKIKIVEFHHTEIYIETMEES